MGDIPDEVEITKIVGDGVSPAHEVNRKITLAYHHLSEAIRLRLDAGPNLDWCGFAKWSSHTVGLDLDPKLVGAEIDRLADRTVEWILKVLPDEQLHSVAQPFLETALLVSEIQEPGFLSRHLDLGHLLSHLRRPGSLFTRIAEGHLPPAFLQDALHAAIVKLLKQEVAVDSGLVTDALRLGNQAIFREMGFVFTRLVNRLPERTLPTAESDGKLAEDIVTDMANTPGRFIPDRLNRALLIDADRKLLVKGIEFYLRAEREKENRDELMLAGNVSFSMYEQARADRLIAIGISAPVRARLIPVVNALSEAPVPPDEVLLAGPKQDRVVIRGVVHAVTEKLTDLGLVVVIAGNRVSLGHPDQLPRPQVTPTLSGVKQVMKEVEDRARGRERNWTDLDYRLGFIGKYFAAFQQNPDAIKEPDAAA